MRCSNIAALVCYSIYFFITLVKPTLLSNHYLQKGALKKHIECVHEGSKPYFCDLCGSAYTNGQALVHHKVKIHKLLTYKCSLCPEIFPKKKDLIEHYGNMGCKFSNGGSQKSKYSKESSVFLCEQT